MGVVRSGLVSGAATVLVTVVGVGPAWASEQAPPDDSTISEQQVDPTVPEQQADTGTVTTGGCDQDPVICQAGVPEGAGLPRTGPHDALLATAAVGGALLVAGAGAVVAGRRRTT